MVQYASQRGERDVSVYEIRVQGRLDEHWATWFEGLTLSYEGDTTVLRGPLADEAALHGVLTKVGNLNLHLLSVNAIETGATASTTSMTPDSSGAVGDRKLAPLDDAPNASLTDTPARKARERKTRQPRKRPPKRHPP